MSYHIFNTEIATKYGIAAAVLFQHIGYWIEHNEANEVNIINGKSWTYNSAKAFTKLFPYLSENQIRNALIVLRENNLLEIGRFNSDPMNRTTWYSFTPKGRKIYYECQFEYNSSNDNNRQIPKQQYGEYNRVLLTKDEYLELIQEYGEIKITEMIKRLDNYLEQREDKRRVYNNHSAVIKQWIANYNKNRKNNTTQQKQQNSNTSFDISLFMEKAKNQTPKL